MNTTLNESQQDMTNTNLVHFKPFGIADLPLRVLEHAYHRPQAAKLGDRYALSKSPKKEPVDESRLGIADVFIETIPYRETREYVTRVEAFSVIYDWRLNGQVRSLSSRLAVPGGRKSATPAASSLRQVICPRSAGTS